MKLTDQIRQTVQACGKTRYRISQETGILESTLSRLMAGNGVSSDTLDTLAEYLELELTNRPKVKESR